MPGDMMVARGSSTVDGSTLFAHNCGKRPGEDFALQLVPGRSFAHGETLQGQFVRLPQVRQTLTVLGTQPAGGWGYDHGINGAGVAIGRTSHQSKLIAGGPVLTGADLVRLALERARTAQQAVDLITDFVERQGQGRFTGCPAPLCDTGFLVADPREAFVIEAAGRHWVCQEIAQVRAMSDVSGVRQDWNRISRGLAAHAIEQGWWPGDGSKLDFAGALSEEPVGQDSALRRWGRATLMLQQQAGHIDTAFLRRLLGDHYESMQSEVDPFATVPGPVPLCQHGTGRGWYTAASLVAALSADPDRLTPAWCAFGPPCITVYFPIFLEGDLPAGFAPSAESVGSLVGRLNEMLRQRPEELPLLSETLARLQGRFDQEAEEFAAEQMPLKQSGARDELRHRASRFMQHHLEEFQAVMDGLLHPQSRKSVPVGQA